MNRNLSLTHCPSTSIIQTAFSATFLNSSNSSILLFSRDALEATNARSSSSASFIANSGKDCSFDEVESASVANDDIFSDDDTLRCERHLNNSAFCSAKSAFFEVS